MDKPKRGGGGKLSRSQTVTVRLDPKLRYLAELAARKQRRTVSSFIEWAIEESLKRVTLREGEDLHDPGATIADEAEALWDVDSADRFAMLALRYPEMLTHDEQILWKLIRENGAVWKMEWSRDRAWVWNVSEDAMRLDELRQHWASFVSVARGEADESTLPPWKDRKPQKDDVQF